MTTWRNLPCSATLPAISQLCPDGWVELYIEHFAGDSGPGGNTPQDPDSSACLGRFWGVSQEDADLAEDALSRWAHDDCESYFALLAAVPHKGTALLRVAKQLTCDRCKRPQEPLHISTMLCERSDCTGGLIGPVLELQPFGVDGKPIYTADEHVSLTGQQPAPQPGRGDMWAQIIERAEGRFQPQIIGLFKERRDLGIARYGTVLQAGNGRDVCDEMVHETLDRIAYAEQAAEERPELLDIMREMQIRDIAHIGALLAAYGRIHEEA